MIFFEFLVNLVFFPTAIINPNISLLDILQPLQIEFYNIIGYLSITLLKSSTVLHTPSNSSKDVKVVLISNSSY